ncbi:MAG: hypothetical protein JW709_05275 [Sedimentisphaerales bacterium]|nr:hypothetical protein [Sedimentisphaerales bacterium]
MFTGTAWGGPAPSGLLCELLAQPEITTIGDATPEFGWIVNSEINDNMQTAYQIMVATSSALLEQNNPDKWNSGKIAGVNSQNISYGGFALSVNQSYFWKVRIWDKLDEISSWSAIQEIKTGSSLSGYNTARYKQLSSEVSPVSVTQIEEGRFLIDFGKDAFGYILWNLPQVILRMGTADTTLIEMSAPEQPQGTVVEIHFGEKLENGVVDRSPDGTIRYYQTTVTLDGSMEYEIHPPGTTTGISIPPEFGRIAPFRYVEMVNCPYIVSTANVRQVSIHYPFNDNAASFQCDNQTLNDVWEFCKYSIKSTSFCAIYVDGDRERKPYEADAYINQLGHYSVDREFGLGRYSYEYLLSHPTWPTEWKQHSIMMAWADYLYTGNSEALTENYYTLKNDKLLQQYAREDGLLNTDGLSDIVDWPSGERDGFVFEPVNTVVNAFYYHTLNLMKQIAEVIGATGDAQQFALDAAQVYQSFQSVLFNNQTGLYVDGEGTTHSAFHANMFPLAFGLVPEDKKQTVVNFVISKGMACSVYGSQYLLEGLYLAGEEDAAFALITSDSTRSWVNMMREGSTISMEAWGIAYKPNLDWNHVWGAVPANIIPRFIAGIRPLTAGFNKAIIHPHPATLNQFQAVISSIRGTISVSMDKQTNNCTFQLMIPANTTVKFVLPKNCDSYNYITLDGIPITPQTDGSLRFIDPIGSGNHVVVCQ